MKKRCILGLMGLMIYLFPVQAQSPWTPEDIVFQVRAGSWTFSPDGSLIAWTQSRAHKQNDRFVSDLYLTYLDRKKDGQFRTVQLTRSSASDYNPVFSADGETLYFLSSRGGGKKIWALDLYGGEAYAIDSFKTSISSLKRLNDHILTYTAQEGQSLYEQTNKQKKDNVVVVEDTVNFKPRRVFSYDLKEKKSTRITDNRFPVRAYEFSPDGKWLISQHQGSPHYPADGKPAPATYLWDLENGTTRSILDQGYQTPGDFQFTSDSKGFYFNSEQSSDPEWQGAGITLLHYYDLGSQRAQQVDVDWDWGLSRSYHVYGSHVLVHLANGPTNKLAVIQKNGATWTRKELDAGARNEHLNLLKLAEKQDKLLVSYSTASTPTQYHLIPLTENLADTPTLAEGEILVKLNAGLEKKTKAKSEIFRWTGALGDEITGILYYPTDYEEGKRYPLMLSIHGGPAGVTLDAWQDRWSTYPHLLAEKGSFVLKPNYHGSSNHGLEFVESIKKHYYEYELTDMLNGIQVLVDRGMVDPDSLGTMGWSAGAILTTMLTVEYPDKFLVAAPGAGDVNWTSDFGTCRFGVTFDQSYFGGAPWDNVDGKTFNEAYILKSPLFEMEKVKTPTIIFHGSEDRAVPRDQGWEYYRSLQQIGKAPVRFLWFPGQPHGLQKITHQLRKIKEELAWFDTYYFGKKAEPQVIKKGSPLFALREKEKAAQENKAWGKTVNGKLIPEVAVAHKDSIALAPFELTHAQYQSFKSDHAIPTGGENHPVVLSFEQAQTYVKWLSRHTGENYRLPSTAEAAALQQQLRSFAASENTLNLWAGYEATVDEVPALMRKVAEFKSSLVKEVGSFSAKKVGAASVYDLGGNVAEYDAEGKPYGYSAYDWVDKYEDLRRSGHVGVRVVKDLE